MFLTVWKSRRPWGEGQPDARHGGGTAYFPAAAACSTCSGPAGGLEMMGKPSEGAWWGRTPTSALLLTAALLTGFGRPMASPCLPSDRHPVPCMASAPCLDTGSGAGEGCSPLGRAGSARCFWQRVWKN